MKIALFLVGWGNWRWRGIQFMGRVTWRYIFYQRRTNKDCKNLYSELQAFSDWFFSSLSLVCLFISFWRGREESLRRSCLIQWQGRNRWFWRGWWWTFQPFWCLSFFFKDSSSFLFDSHWWSLAFTLFGFQVEMTASSENGPPTQVDTLASYSVYNDADVQEVNNYILIAPLFPHIFRPLINPHFSFPHFLSNPLVWVQK